MNVLTASNEVDVVIVGAGFSGVYMLKKALDLGLRAVVLEAAPDVGGTWFWNKYPGARCDVESLEYSYSFSEELQQEWVWTERYASQPEIQRYLRHVVAKFGLAKNIRLQKSVVSAVYDSNKMAWVLSCEDGDTYTGRFCVMGTGCLSKPQAPDIPGINDFRGETYHTGEWPEQMPDFTGKKVGVIGTGSSAVQLIPIAAQVAEHLYVFQRTANFVIPAQNRPLEAEKQREHKLEYEARRASARATPFCIGGHPPPLHVATELLPEELEKTYQKKWETGGAISFLYSFKNLLVDPASNETAGEFVRQKIRSIVKDPVTAEDLCPNDHYIGTKRLCLGNDYYETYNKPNVTLVNIRKDPIQSVGVDSLSTTKKSYPLDVLIFATGFDAMTGTLFAIDIIGKDGLKLREAWRAGPKTYLGLMTASFPNMFFVAGAGSPSVKSNMVCAIEQHVNWISDCIQTMGKHGHKQIECEPSAEEDWTLHVAEVANSTLYPTAKSWYTGENLPGKPRVFSPYVAGLDVYDKICRDVVSKNYMGFKLN